MKTIILPLLLGISMLSHYCIGSAQSMEELKTVHKVLVSSKINLEIERSEDFSLKISSPDLQEDCLIQNIENGKLILKLKGAAGCIGEINALLRIPKLTSIEAMGGAEVYTRNVFKTDELTIILRSKAETRVSMDVQNLSAQISEGALLVADGYATQQNITVGSKASFSAFELNTEKTRVTTSFGGVAKIFVEEELNAAAKTNSYISYKGKPKRKNIEEKSGGKVEQSDVL